MPNTCSVFGCKSNYRGHPSATVFKLPSSPRDLRDKWIRALHSDMATELLEDKIIYCIHHFREEDIMRVDRTVQADGAYTETPRIRPTYRFNAGTSYFPRLLQLLRKQSVLVENLWKKKTSLKVFMMVSFKTNKIVYNSL